MAERVIALAGNPNVGKSTVFNSLTGMRRHTGNWSGKTVDTAAGRFRRGENEYILVDLPGTYSLLTHSAEEEVARDFLGGDDPDGVVIVCDAACLGRNLNLALQVLEMAPHRPTVLCVNLMDEAEAKGIKLDLDALSSALGVTVVGMSARRRGEAARLGAALDRAFAAPTDLPVPLCYAPEIESAIAARGGERWRALQHLSEDPAMVDGIVSTLHARACEIASAAVSAEGGTACGYTAADARRDRILTGRRTAYPIMLVLLFFILWLTVEGANYPSAWLGALFGRAESGLLGLMEAWGAPAWLTGVLVEGVWRTLGRVVSVMLPPMLIFFPLFTLMEDAGYLPRIAYNLDRPFRACRACGKQALCMCMGFGCNAVGVVGCRIIDSRRERLLAVLTNSFVPCNGRFPTLIALIVIFFAGNGGGAVSALLLLGLILVAVAVSFGVTWLLSHTLLRGMPSAFTLEMPPFRRPRVGRVLVSAVVDRTLFVLGRAAAVAAPAGLVIWGMANVTVGEMSLLGWGAAALEPLGRLMGMDGAILLAFILGLPANEIVRPIVLMIYPAGGSLGEVGSSAALGEILVANGWDGGRAACVLIFTLFHWPCSTTLLTVKRETGSAALAALAALLPTAVGVLLCIVVNVIRGSLL
ncbi:MAG: ferrous iron transport protein B [Clostridia bacterium]|nr:ferrous iron transport protein B [Clostridia bacterium]